MAPAIPFSELTTLQVGGPARRLVTATTQRDLVDLAREAWQEGEPWLALGGGSNLLVGDEGFDGTVIRVATKGIEVLRRDVHDGAGADVDDDADAPDDGDSAASVRLRVQAGETWDDLVAWTVEHGYSGFEALSGIPGSVGAAPVQNIGAYGQELESTLVAIEFLDEGADAPRRMSADELELGYRTSVLKRGLRGIVVSVEFELHDTELEQAVLGEALGRPIAYAQLADALHVQPRRPGADRAGARERARAARLQGHGARPGGSRLGECRLVLHEPDRDRARGAHAARRGPAMVPRRGCPRRGRPTRGERRRLAARRSSSRTRPRSRSPARRRMPRRPSRS